MEENWKEKYEKAVKEAQGLLDSLAEDYKCTNFTKNDLKRIYSYSFPEIKPVSEDDLMINFIRDELERYRTNERDNSDRYIKLTDALEWLESQRRIDVLDEEEREFADNVNGFREEVDTAYHKGFDQGVKATLEKMKDWDSEDDKNYIDCIKRGLGFAATNNYYSSPAYYDLLNYLDMIPQRLFEKEKALSFERNLGYNDGYRDGVDKKWEPSDVQMLHLKSVINAYPKGSLTHSTLESLHNELLKLKDNNKAAD